MWPCTGTLLANFDDGHILMTSTGFIPAMLAMQQSYRMLKEEKSDLKACQGRQIKHFFEQVGLKSAFDFDTQVIQHIKKDVPSQKYENLSHHDLF
jgi:hypothetical protein